MNYSVFDYIPNKETVDLIINESFLYTKHSLMKWETIDIFWKENCLPAYKILFLKNEQNEIVGLCAYYLLEDIEAYKPYNDLYLYVSVLEVKKEYRGKEYALQMLDEIKKLHRGKVIHLNADSDSVLHGYYLQRNRFKLLDKKERLFEFF